MRISARDACVRPHFHTRSEIKTFTVDDAIIHQDSMPFSTIHYNTRISMPGDWSNVVIKL